MTKNWIDERKNSFDRRKLLVSRKAKEREREREWEWEREWERERERERERWFAKWWKDFLSSGWRRWRGWRRKSNLLFNVGVGVGWLAVIAKCQYANKYQLLARLKDIYKNRNRKNNEQECHEK